MSPMVPQQQPLYPPQAPNPMPMPASAGAMGVGAPPGMMDQTGGQMGSLADAMGGAQAGPPAGSTADPAMLMAFLESLMSQDQAAMQAQAGQAMSVVMEQFGQAQQAALAQVLQALQAQLSAGAGTLDGPGGMVAEADQGQMLADPLAEGPF